MRATVDEQMGLSNIRASLLCNHAMGKHGGHGHLVHFQLVRV
jgi:hypothetical protein